MQWRNEAKATCLPMPCTFVCVQREVQGLHTCSSSLCPCHPSCRYLVLSPKPTVWACWSGTSEMSSVWQDDSIRYETSAGTHLSLCFNSDSGEITYKTFFKNLPDLIWSDLRQLYKSTRLTYKKHCIIRLQLRPSNDKFSFRVISGLICSSWKGAAILKPCIT